MAIGTPTLLRAAQASSTTATTAAFTPTAGALLVVDAAIQHNNALPDEPTMSDNGAGFTWTASYSGLRDPGGTFSRQRLKQWTATVPASPAPMTITVSGSSGVAFCIGTVRQVTGAQPSATNYSTGTSGSGRPAVTLPATPAADSVVLTALLINGTAAIGTPTGYTRLSLTTQSTTFNVETAYDASAPSPSLAWTGTGNQGSVGAAIELTPTTAGSVGGFTENMALSDTVGSVGVAVSAGFTEAATTADSVGSLGTSSTTSPENPAGTWSSAAASWKLPAGGDSKGINALTASGVTATTLQGPAGTFLASSYARRTAPTFTALSAFSIETWVQPTTFGRIFRIGSTTVAATTRAELRTNSDGSYTLTRTVGAATQTSSSVAGIATTAAQHVMAVFPSGANHLLYINGAAVTLTHTGAAVTGAIAISSTDEVAIGNPSPSGLTGMAGKIGRVTLWPFAASATRAAVAYRHQSDAARWIGFSGENQAGETNRAPVAVPFRYAALPGVAKTINVRARAYDPDGDTLNIVTDSLVPSTGTASLTGGDIVATAPSSFTGEQTVQFDLRDTAGKTSRAKIYGTVAAISSYAWKHKPPASLLPASDSDIIVWKVPAAGGNAPSVAAGQTLLLTMNDLNEPIYGTINFDNAGNGNLVAGIGLTLRPRGVIRAHFGGNDVYGINAMFNGKFLRQNKHQALFLANIDYDPRPGGTHRDALWGDFLKFGTQANAAHDNYDEWMDYYCEKVLLRVGSYGFTDDGTGDVGNRNDPHSDFGQMSRGGVRDCYFGDVDVRWGYQTFFLHGADTTDDDCHPQGRIFYNRVICRSQSEVAALARVPKYMTNVGKVDNGTVVNAELTAGNYYAAFFTEMYAETSSVASNPTNYAQYFVNSSLSPSTKTGTKLYFNSPFKAASRDDAWMNGFIDFSAPATPIVTESEIGSALAVRTGARLRELLSV